jgi:hypothetical protein
MRAIQLSRENAVRVRGGNRADGIREQSSQCVDFREDVIRVGDESRIAPEATDVSLVR